ncbi:MAG: mevalonate kinase [Candidatus Diapherotrites archaeon]
MGTGSGFGKTILFGEHFVVYGMSAIACALGDATTAKVGRVKLANGKKYELVDNRPETPGYKVQKRGEYEALIENVLAFMGVKEQVRITLGGTLVAASGVGASAACATALARAIDDEFKMGRNNEKINEAAYEGEKGPHGTPSGIDNTAAVYGGMIVFRKGADGGKNEMEKLKMEKPVEIVLGNSGRTSSTKEVIADVRRLKDEKPNETAKVFDEYEKIAEEAKKALLASDFKKVGGLMNKNHGLLQKITVSCDELDEMVGAARGAGALGAKLTGTGRGGLMVALTPGKDLQGKVAEAIEKLGYSSVKTRIGV